MSRLFFVYMLYEHPPESPYYCKVGFTSLAPARFAALQEGNPRTLKRWQYEREGIKYFGMPFPSRRDAKRFESDFLSAVDGKGNRLARHYEFNNEWPVAREWVQGIHPEELWCQLLRSYADYLHIRQNDFHFMEHLEELLVEHRRAHKLNA